MILEGLHRVPQGRTLGKIKEHLASIYRVFIREGILDLRLDGQLLQYEEPAVSNAPYYKTPNAKPVLWRKDIDFDFGEGQSAVGFAALRERASVSGAGFALFRRKRLIQGSADEGYRPEAIFGKSNSYRYQRLFGELHLKGFEVSHTRTGFAGKSTRRYSFLSFEKHLNSRPLPLLTQAESIGYVRRDGHCKPGPKPPQSEQRA